MYSKSEVYQLECSECPMKYIGQTRHTFRACFKEHIQDIRTNRHNSKYAQHILDKGHAYNTMDQTMRILHIEKKGHKLNTFERYEIYKLTKKAL
jgi:GTPase SAR1 family protein